MRLLLMLMFPTTMKAFYKSAFEVGKNEGLNNALEVVQELERLY